MKHTESDFIPCRGNAASCDTTPPVQPAGDLYRLCSVCNISKPLSEYDVRRDSPTGHKGYCKQCRNKRAKARRDTGHRVREYEKSEAQKSRRKEYRCSEQGRKKYAEYKQSESYRQKERRYEQSEKAKLRRRKYTITRYREDPQFNLKMRLRRRALDAIQKQGYGKNTKTMQMLGCDWKHLKQHIESQFSTGMTWENKHLWHVDHIIPLVSAKTEEELIKLCHWTNLQPLWAEDNLRKSINERVSNV